MKENRTGIASGGNWIVDRLKIIDTYPEKGMLANIAGESYAIAGAPANVLQDLVQLQAPFPLTGVGIIGNDKDGAYIREQFAKLPIDISGLLTGNETTTSYTDVMSEKNTGLRTFFHSRGANALFNKSHVPIEHLSCKIFHLGYLLLLDSLDAENKEHGTEAAFLLYSLQKEGIKTSVDVVSEDSLRFKIIVPPSLKYTDYLIINEIEAGRIVDIKIRGNDGSLSIERLEESIELLASIGSMEYIVIHMPEGSIGRLADGTLVKVGSLKLPENYIVGTVGAGDAFCSGVLYGTHEGWSLDRSIKLGTCCAAASLSAIDGVSGIRSFDDVMALGNSYPYRNF